MAITQVRAKLGTTWTVLTYNEATGRYEGTLDPPGTSVHQPGGYYNVTVEATNSTGQTATLDGTQYKGLRLVVRETAAPTITLISPPAGYLTTASPAFVFQAQDEEGGSGIDPDSAQATIDGVPAACTVTESGGVYTLTFSGASLSEGQHLVTVSISDLDGNETTVSAAYIVDTVPPVLTVISPDLHRVVDWEEVTVSGWARDATSGVAEIKVNGETVGGITSPSGGGAAGGGGEGALSVSSADSSPKGGALEAGGTGEFSNTVPLEVGENTITVTATDQAGLTTTKTLWMLRMVTDRTQADGDAVKAFLQKPWEEFTQDEKAVWTGVVRGYYNDEDMDRVGTAVEHIADTMIQAGYSPGVSPKTDWTEHDAPSQEQRETYLDNVSKLKALLPISEPQVPADMEGFTFQEANDIETILVSADRLFPLMERSGVYSGEAFSGEF